MMVVGMRFNRPALVFVLVALLCNVSATPTTLAGNEVLTIEIFDKPAMFRPDHSKIKVGQSIKWINKGETVHTRAARRACRRTQAHRCVGEEG